MKPAAVLIPAPKRGRYDRALSRHQRQAAQQERVIAAIAAVAALGRELSIASIAEHAGIGRNTFYEYFDDVEHALSAINARARRELMARVEPALRLARTPLERVRALSRAWVEAYSANRALTALALRTPSGGRASAELSVLGSCIAVTLEGEVSSRAALPGLADLVRITAVAAVFEAVTRTAVARTTGDDELSRTLTDLALRLLR
jgi:AcrR family transcriptional regulator